jgi:hypothetical protein
MFGQSHVPGTIHNSIETSCQGRCFRPELGTRTWRNWADLRHSRKDSLNTGWHNTSFRGFADYMLTPEFQTGIKTLIQAAKREQVAIMCAEAVPWRCHRSLIADALEVCGIAVEDIMSEHRVQAHELTSFAKVVGAHVTYPAPD